MSSIILLKFKEEKYNIEHKYRLFYKQFTWVKDRWMKILYVNIDFYVWSERLKYEESLLKTFLADFLWEKNENDE